MNNELLRALLEDRSAWELVSFDTVDDTPVAISRRFGAEPLAA